MLVAVIYTTYVATNYDFFTADDSKDNIMMQARYAYPFYLKIVSCNMVFIICYDQFLRFEYYLEDRTS